MFIKAIPVFAKGEEASLNYPLTLTSSVDTLDGTTLYISAFSFYRLFVNGNFVCMGPARAAKGYARVDVLELGKYGREGKNTIEIQVAGYNCGALSTARQTSFVICELRRDDEVILYTGRDFEGYLDCRRVREVERYSAQRHFGEIWRIGQESFNRKQNRVELAGVSNNPSYLPRRAPMPTYGMINAESIASFGTFEFDENLPYRAMRSSFPISKEWGRFEEEDVLSHPFRWVQRQKKECKVRGGSFPITLSNGEYVTVDMGRIESGFICWSGKAVEQSDVVIAYSEMCDADNFAFTDINCHNVIEYLIEADVSVDEQSFEPYNCKVAVVMVRSGKIELAGFGVRAYEHDRSRFIKREIKDSELAAIYGAAESTFAHNALDIYMDCPSRERTGWLCDSYFTGKAEYFLTGESAVEDAFLENYRLYESKGEFPEGVLPMCYPSDEHEGNKFIPQWNMWYVLEVKEYLCERNKTVDRELFRKSVYGVVDFLKRHENADGLLQNLPSWNFVEWSTASEWAHDVNYPTNFLYAEVLRSAGELYSDSELLERAERVAKKTRELSFNGELFIDNAVIGDDGRPHNTKNFSEAGQYYAILFGGFDVNEDKYASLRSHISENFASFVPTDGQFISVNIFIGFYLKICALMKMEKPELLKDCLKDFLMPMVLKTGTIWEYKQIKGSHDHGFASLAAAAIAYVEKIK